MENNQKTGLISGDENPGNRISRNVSGIISQDSDSKGNLRLTLKMSQKALTKFCMETGIQPEKMIQLVVEEYK